MRHASAHGRALGIGVLVAVLLLASSCRKVKDGEYASPWDSEFATLEEIRENSPNLEKGKSAIRNTYVAVVADRGVSEALGFCRLRFDLWAPFSLSARFGVPRLDRAAGLGDGIFGIELDARLPAQRRAARAAVVEQFYGLYAHRAGGDRTSGRR